MLPKVSSGLEIFVVAGVILVVLFGIGLAQGGVKKPEGPPFAVTLSTGEFLVCDKFWNNQAICQVRHKVPEGVRLFE